MSIRKQYDDALADLQQALAEMGQACADAVENAMEALASTDAEAAAQIIQDEKLKEPETRKFLENAFRDGEVKTTGTDIDKLMPPVSRFGKGGARAKKKQTVIEKLKGFFDRFFGIGEASFEK